MSRNNALQPAQAPSVLRDTNRRLLLHTLFQHGPTTRPDLARRIGLSQPTVFAVLDDLARAGLVRTFPTRGSRAGRPALTYEANPAAGTVTCVDVGRDWIRVLVTDLAAAELQRMDVPNTARTGRGLVSLIARSVHQTVEAAGLRPDEVTHTVVGSPGVFNPHENRLTYAGNLPGWGKPGIVEALAESIGTEITIENDANLAAVGEYTYGAGKDSDPLIYLTIGSGVGLGIVLQGEIFRGYTGAAGELGYLPIGQVNTPGEIRRGILEESVAADAVVSEARSRGLGEDFHAADVFASARAGDKVARQILRTEARNLAYAIASITALLDPQLIILGGGIGQNLDMLRRDIDRTLEKITPLRCRVESGRFGGDAVLRGAMAIGVEKAQDVVFARQLDDLPRS
ncbi:ROK family protein [Jatrophihabitans sp. DSM 45814]